MMSMVIATASVVGNGGRGIVALSSCSPEGGHGGERGADGESEGQGRAQRALSGGRTESCEPEHGGCCDLCSCGDGCTCGMLVPSDHDRREPAPARMPAQNERQDVASQLIVTLWAVVLFPTPCRDRPMVGRKFTRPMTDSETGARLALLCIWTT